MRVPHILAVSMPSGWAGGAAPSGGQAVVNWFMGFNALGVGGGRCAHRALLHTGQLYGSFNALGVGGGRCAKVRIGMALHSNALSFNALGVGGGRCAVILPFVLLPAAYVSMPSGWAGGAAPRLSSMNFEAN